MSKFNSSVLENFDQNFYYDTIDVSSETNKHLIDYVLDNYKRLPDGRLQLPLLWKPEVSHLLGKIKELSMSILNPISCRLKPNGVKLWPS